MELVSTESQLNLNPKQVLYIRSTINQDGSQVGRQTLNAWIWMSTMDIVCSFQAPWHKSPLNQAFNMKELQPPNAAHILHSTPGKRWLPPSPHQHTYLESILSKAYLDKHAFDQVAKSFTYSMTDWLCSYIFRPYSINLNFWATETNATLLNNSSLGPACS